MRHSIKIRLTKKAAGAMMAETEWEAVAVILSKLSAAEINKVRQSSTISDARLISFLVAFFDKST